MHETALMESVLAIIYDSAKENGLKKVTKVKLKVGELTNALPEALELAFEASKGEILDIDAVLEIEFVKTTIYCPQCNQSFIVDDFKFSCPNCLAQKVKIIAGEELLIDYYEGE